MKTESRKINRNDVVLVITILATILSIVSAVGLEHSKGGSVFSLVSALGIFVGPVTMAVCLYFLNQIYHPFETNPFADYKSQAIWSEETGELMSLILSTGEKVMPETKASSILDLMDFLWKNHRSELTWWGKISYWMNQ